MEFKDHEIEQLDLEKTDDFSKLILKYLCGKEYNPNDIDEQIKNHIETIIKDMNKNNLNYEQFNEVLLLYNQDRLSRDFFNYFFSSGFVNIETLKKGITEFRGLSILHFGNFDFSYKQFYRSKKFEIDKHFQKYLIPPSVLEQQYATRPNPLIDLEKVEKANTWHLGYLSKGLYDAEKETLDNMEKISKEPNEYKEIKEILSTLKEDIKNNRELGKKKTDVYLIWDYIDVYIATSMRKNCEYEETYEIIEKIFNNPNIRNLKLRFFDPTQSFCEPNRDKGLIEGLMLKRADCTIYMIQESDTFGKDSELASTLAQKKPVIAFIPDYEIEVLCKKIKGYPLEYIKERIFMFRAKNEFDKIEIFTKLGKDDLFELHDFFDEYIKQYEEYRLDQPFSLWKEKEDEFKERNSYFEEVCNILAYYTKEYWNKRANTLKDYHPLGMQIDLDSGVANGVLVVRDIENCVKILRGIITNSLEFEIRHFEEGYTGLIEVISGCLYRIVTDNKLLTTSFWNFFYKV